MSKVCARRRSGRSPGPAGCLTGRLQGEGDRGFCGPLRAVSIRRGSSWVRGAASQEPRVVRERCCSRNRQLLEIPRVPQAPLARTSAEN